MKIKPLLRSILAALFLGSPLAAGPSIPAAEITDHAIWKQGKPVDLLNPIRPPVTTWWVFRSVAPGWTYTHHASIAAFKGRLYAIWSNGHRDEDRSGQRVMYAVGDEQGHWSTPQVLFTPGTDPDGVVRVLTAGGFHAYNGTLVAYAGDYTLHKKLTTLLARTTTDGTAWSDVRDLHVPVCPNHPPQPTASGRLIMTGNIAFPYTDDPSGLTGWKMSGIYPPEMEPIEDNPKTFWDVARHQGWPTGLCEGAFYQTDDGVLHMMLRSVSRPKTVMPHSWNLWESTSADDGVTWSTPHETKFSNIDAKIHFGRLPDGRYDELGNPIGSNRFPLVLSTSHDGIVFDRHYYLGREPYTRQFPGDQKGGDYGYPHSMIYHGRLYVICSRAKEAICVLSVALSDIRETAPANR